MNGKYKLGLTRNRVFALENCVYFSADFSESVDTAQLLKSLSMLREKYPLLGCVIELDGNGEAYAVETLASVPFALIDGDAAGIIREECSKGFDFTKELFRVLLINGSMLAFFGHTAVCDVCSLALLAGELVRFYKRESFDIERREPELLSEKSDLPDKVKSVVAERVANSLNFSWIKNDKQFSYFDYAKAAQAYSAKKPQQKKVCAYLSASETSALISRCRNANADASAVAAFCFFEQLVKYGGTRADRHVLWQCNERIYLSENEARGIGPYNSVAAVNVQRLRKKGLTPLAAFQNETYKKHATCFDLFYDSVYFAEVLPQICDAAYLFEAGVFKNRIIKRFSEKEFNMHSCLLGCGFLNLDQQYWASLKSFDNISFSEPFSRRMRFCLNVLLCNGELKFELSYREGEIEENVLLTAMEDAVKMLKNVP